MGKNALSSLFVSDSENLFDQQEAFLLSVFAEIQPTNTMPRMLICSPNYSYLETPNRIT